MRICKLKQKICVGLVCLARKTFDYKAAEEIYSKIKEDLKTLVKKTKKAIEAGDPKVEELVKKTLRAFDKAAQKGVVKKNTKDRKKSRLHQRLNKSKKTK